MKIIKIFSNAIFILFIIFTIYFLFNYKLYFVASGSMQPTFRINELIVVKVTNNSKEYEIGDIITFFDKNIESNVTHRIVELTENNVYTKGDYNNTRDLYPVTYANIIGKVIWSSYFLGCLLLKYKYILIILLLLSVFAFNLILDDTTKNSKERRHLIYVKNKKI